jgi:hypothetical protein
MVIQQILRYLIEHPDAKDTVQGILRWWLPKDPVERSEEEVQEVLEVLVARGWMTKRQTITSQELYGMNKEKLNTIQAFLRKGESKAEGQCGGRDND